MQTIITVDDCTFVGTATHPICMDLKVSQASIRVIKEKFLLHKYINENTVRVYLPITC